MQPMLGASSDKDGHKWGAGLLTDDGRPAPAAAPFIPPCLPEEGEVKGKSVVVGVPSADLGGFGVLGASGGLHTTVSPHSSLQP